MVNVGQIPMIVTSENDWERFRMTKHVGTLGVVPCNWYSKLELKRGLQFHLD